MMSGKPILNGVVASNNEVDEAGCGVSFDSSYAEKIAEAIKHLISMDENERIKMGLKGTKWVKEHCDYEILAKRFIDCTVAE